MRKKQHDRGRSTRAKGGSPPHSRQATTSDPAAQQGQAPAGTRRLLRPVMLLMGFGTVALCWALWPAGTWRAALGAIPLGGSPSASPAASLAPFNGTPTLQSYEVVRELPHDPNAFTQGLEFDRNCSGAEGACRDIFWESTGMEGRSTVREVLVDTGRVLRSHLLPGRDFGEGITRFQDKLYQLTWLSGKTWVYDVADFDNARATRTPLSDGWGITLDGSTGRELVVSDGSATLSWLDPADLSLRRQVTVTDGGQEVHSLNELEWVEGEVWANVWLTECIARIHPVTGNVTGWVEMQGLRSRQLQQSQNQQYPMDVLNGIAYDAAGRRLFVTGKNWPRLYEVRLRSLEGDEPALFDAARLAAARARCVLAAGSQGRRLLAELKGLAAR